VSVAENLQAIRGRVNAACARAGRDPGAVTILAASKGMPPEIVTEAANAGVILFGENKVQEARAKISACPGRLRWHLIGHLQSNKCRDAVSLFEMIQSVDSVALAAEIQKCAEKQARTMPVLLEVNVAGESTKFGVKPADVVAAILEINAFPRIEIRGFMTMAPWSESPEKVRPVFRRLREVQRTGEDALGAPLPELSMGMSADFEVAIEEGATIVRIGTSLFGPRPKPARE